MRTVTIFGGSGFVGRYLVQKFADQGDLIRVAVRNPLSAQFLKPLCQVGQLSLLKANLLNSEEVERGIEGSDVVINLVGILGEMGSQTFEAIHVHGAAHVAKKASEAGVPVLLHMSALGANKNSPSRYASTKALGEEAVLEHFPAATLFRPSVIFGPEDSFFNRFAHMACFSPFLPLIGGGETRFQPIYVGDVAEVFLRASVNKEALGKTYELGGPAIYTFKDLMIYLLKAIHRKRILLPIPFGFARIIAAIVQYFPSSPLTPDQVELLKADTVVSPQALTVEDLSVYPKALEVLAPLYLKRYG